MSLLVMILRITNVRGQIVDVAKYSDGTVRMAVQYASFPTSPKVGQMHYEPASNRMYVYGEPNGWEKVGDSLIDTNNPIDYNDPKTARSAGISVMGYQVMISPSINSNGIMVLGDVLFVNEPTAALLNEEITKGSGPTMVAAVQAASSIANQSREQRYTLDASALNVMQGYRARMD